jgi:hypothetical protein
MIVYPLRRRFRLLFRSPFDIFLRGVAKIKSSVVYVVGFSLTSHAIQSYLVIS